VLDLQPELAVHLRLPMQEPSLDHCSLEIEVSRFVLLERQDYREDLGNESTLVHLSSPELIPLEEERENVGPTDTIHFA